MRKAQVVCIALVGLSGYTTCCTRTGSAYRKLTLCISLFMFCTNLWKTSGINHACHRTKCVAVKSLLVTVKPCISVAVQLRPVRPKSDLGAPAPDLTLQLHSHLTYKLCFPSARLLCIFCRSAPVSASAALLSLSCRRCTTMLRSS